MCILSMLRLHRQPAGRTPWEMPSKWTKTTLGVRLGLYIQNRQKVFRVRLKFCEDRFQGAPTGCILSIFRVTLNFTYKTGRFSQSYLKQGGFHSHTQNLRGPSSGCTENVHCFGQNRAVVFPSACARAHVHMCVCARAYECVCAYECARARARVCVCL